MGRFDGKVALVTGATSGIGRATAQAFAAEGARVVIAGRRAQRGSEVVAHLSAAGLQAAFVQADVRDPESVAAMLELTADLYGRLDFAVNNAGISGTNQSITQYPESVWDDVMATNLKGVWLCLKHEIPLMRRTGGGSIVNVSSDLGLVGSALQVAPYVASKHGVIGLTRAAALEYATERIRVNAVCPSFTETEMLEPAMAHDPGAARWLMIDHIPLKRIADPAEIASAIVWLCSSEATFVTGHALSVDGGAVAR